MLFGKSYSTKSLTIAIDAMRVIDSEITHDFIDHGPEKIPKDHEWQLSGLGSMFDERKESRETGCI